MIEYRLIPLMVSVIKIGDELSAAALTRGLGAPIRRTNVCEIGFHVQDFIAIVVCFACFILFFLHQYIVFEVVHYDKNRSCNIYIWRK